MDSNDPQGDTHRSVSRRRFVQAAGASGVVVGLSGCLYGGGGGGGGGNGSGGGGGASGTVQWGFDPTQAQENGDAITQLFYDNGLSQDIDLQLVPGNSDTGQRQQKYNQLLNAGQSQPDMFMMDSGWTIPFIQREQLLNLTEALPQSAIQMINNNYFQSAVETAKQPDGDALYGVPLFPDFPAMHYRKDLANQAGYDTSNWATEPMTWQRFSEIAADVSQQNDLDMGFTFQFDVYEGTSCCDYNEFMSSWGGAYFGGRENLFGPIGDRPVTVDQKPAVDALRMIRSFIYGSDDPESLDGYQQISPTGVLSWTEETSRAPFEAGRAFAHRNWPYAIPLTISNADWASPDSYGVMPLPYKVSEQNAQGVGGSTAALGGWHMTVNPNTQNQEAALQVIQTAMKDEVSLGLWELAAWLPPKPDLFDAEAATSVDPTGQYLNTLRVAGETAMPRPVTVAWPDQSGQIAQTVNAVASQNRPPQQAMNSLKGTLNDIESEIGSS
jgi:maltose-binding protein MalE